MMRVFEISLPQRSLLRDAITQTYCIDETQCLQQLLKVLDWHSEEASAIEKTAIHLVESVREKEKTKNAVDALMAYYDLSSEEGILLMCLAEALLRIPDKETEDLLIKDKLTGANWGKHLGASESRFVNLMTWGLAVSGKILTDQSDNFFQKIWHGLLSRCGEPVIREAVRRTMKIMSEHFVLGRTIKEALKRSVELIKKGYFFSYDMLGEMARTEVQAQYYFTTYQQAIAAVGASIDKNTDLFSRPSISIKLSALHPRYEFSHQKTVVPFLTKQLKTLALQAKEVGISLTIDAEEAARLDLSLDIFEQVFIDPELANWSGLGLAVQAYQKRAYSLIQWLIDLAKTHHKKISIRLVKGAYWDSEIKWSQVGGYDHYPVFTRKVYTDVCYLACAKLILSETECIYPQFATHNAYTAAAILHMVKETSFEFQCLQGMGSALHDVLIQKEKYDAKSRIYAPVGKHKDLLPYLVRRLLENGANTSFVHQISNAATPIEKLTKNPIKAACSLQYLSNPKIPLPKNLYSSGRLNSAGFDITREDQLKNLLQTIKSFSKKTWLAAPMHRELNVKTAKPIINPNDSRDVVGYVELASPDEMHAALQKAETAFFEWDQLSVENRALLLEKTADLIEAETEEYIALLMREAGKVFQDAIAEIREAVDFCRYYAEQAKMKLIPQILEGPTGESNVLRYHGRGTMICISPWNFPLAIFTGQVVASLVAGNCVIAKPAQQTPLIAAKTVELLHQAGIPASVVQLMPASGRQIGEALLTDERAVGVLFTGSTDTAKTIQQILANRKGAIVPFIAETGGINVMIVDSSALLEQLVVDIMISAFGSAGQRCSALRMVLVQSDIADAFLDMLKGAMQTWTVTVSDDLSADVGPVIDQQAKRELQTYIDEMYQQTSVIAQMTIPDESKYGSFIAPIAFELSDFSQLTKEVFGPVLHVMRYERDELDDLIAQINALGYGLTFGIQSRIDTSVDYLQKRIKTGNIYVNRTMIGAVVGVQPFGGCGLSGTGPKAGGPNYLLRLCRESTLTINTTATGGNTALLACDD